MCGVWRDGLTWVVRDALAVGLVVRNGTRITRIFRQAQYSDEHGFWFVAEEIHIKIGDKSAVVNLRHQRSNTACGLCVITRRVD